MDNLTHSLIGVVVGKAAIRLSPKLRESSRSRRAALWAAVLGNNAPDLDALGARYWGNGKLDYLLNHRGYSHTILFSPALGALSAVAALALVRGWGSESRGAKRAVFALGCVSVLLHILADFGNDYGVHPFTPFWNRWFYGGSILIVEPWLWAAMLPQLVFGFRSRVLRGIGIAWSIALLALLWSFRFTPPPIAAAVTVGMILSMGLAWYFRHETDSRGTSLRPTLIAMACVYGAFIGAGAIARQDVRAEIRDHRPDEGILSISTSPAPGNPFCWRTIAQTAEGMGTDLAQVVLRERVGVRSLWPSVFSPRSCLAWERPLTEHAAPLEPATLPQTDAQFWRGEFVSNAADFVHARDRYCQFAAFLLFAREPFWFPGDGGLMIGDLRYDSGRGAFSTLQARTGSAADCLSRLPPWDPPSGFSQWASSAGRSE